MKLKTLSILTGFLFAISIVVFLNENRRGTDLLSGSDYIKGLDIGKVQKIALHFKEGKKITLARSDSRFILEDHKSYPAASNKINDLIFQIASLRVREKVGSNVGEDDLKKYELDQKSKQYLVEIFDNDGKKTVAFRVGKDYKGKGNYLYKEGGKDVYLSENPFRLNSSPKDFINTILFDIGKEKIEKIELESQAKIELAKEGDAFVVKTPSKKKFKKEKIDEYVGSFSSVGFEDYYSYSDPKVRGLNFNKQIRVLLKNKLIYRMGLAKDKKNHFIKLNASIDESSQKIVIHKDDGQDKLKNIEDVVKAQGKAQRINLERGGWIYQIDEATYKKLVVGTSFFM
ncbi:MAG: DUF4340 domain-containing protein [Bacteriovoracales bacterium]|nr:DUF4340 domain-containing protein [Bacteriovoracales bacterium]